MSEIVNGHELELDRPLLGELLVNAGVLPRDILTKALAEQAESSLPLGRILVDRGYVPAHKIAMALADQQGQPVRTEYGFASGHAAPAAELPEPRAVPAIPVAAAPPEAEPPLFALPSTEPSPAAASPSVMIGPIEVYLPAEIVEVNGHRYAVAKLESAVPSSDEIVAAFRQKTEG